MHVRKFDRSINGYNVAQVNAFVDDVVDKVDDMITKMKQKDLEIERLTNELEHYKKMDATINRAVVTEAKKNANRIINDALLKAEKYEEDAARLRRNIVAYKRRMKNLIDQQSEIIDDLDKVDIE